jgi:Uma2 family endonuclease
MVQLPLEARPSSEPEPDLALVEEEPSGKGLYRTALLVIEVAVSSHEKDRGEKAHIYAQADIPSYWLVDVRSEPGPEGYSRCEIYGVGASVPSPVEGVADLDVGELLEDMGG